MMQCASLWRGVTGWQKAAVLVAAMLVAVTPVHASSDSDNACLDGAGDSQQTAEMCVQQELDAQNQEMAQAYRALQTILSPQESAALDTTQQQWLSYRSSYCHVFVQVAGRDNPAWQMTWSRIAALACEAELSKEHVIQLKSLENVANRRAEQSRVLQDSH